MKSDLSVLFRGLTGSLQLFVESYEFPDVTDDWWDANWLVVRGHGVLYGRSWDFRDACLTTFELERLASWLDGVAHGEKTPAFCRFTEPNLELGLAANRNIQLLLCLEAVPPWADRSTEVVAFEVPVDPDLADLAADLRQILARFSVRSRGNAFSSPHVT